MHMLPLLLATAAAFVLQLSGFAMARDHKWFVFTELKSDDGMMLYLLSQNPDIIPTALIVGDGLDIAMSVARARHWLSIFYPEQHQSIEIIAGDSGEKQNDEDEGNAEGISGPVNLPESVRVVDDRLPELLQEAKANGDHIHIISAKPMTELFRVWKADRTAFTTAEAFSYLGYNVRKLYNNGTAENEISEFINTAFGMGHMAFERSQLLGQGSTCKLSNADAFWKIFLDKVARGDQRLELMEKILTYWNGNIRDRKKTEIALLLQPFELSDDVKEEINDIVNAGGLDEPKLLSYLPADADKEIVSLVLKKAKIITHINQDGLGTQFMIADPLIAVYLGGYLEHLATPKAVRFDVDPATKESLYLPRENSRDTVKLLNLDGDDVKTYDKATQRSKALDIVIDAMTDILMEKPAKKTYWPIKSLLEIGGEKKVLFGSYRGRNYKR